MAKKAKSEVSSTEHLKFGNRTYVISVVDGVFWALCPALGDAVTRSANSREDLLKMLTEDTGASPETTVVQVPRSRLFSDENIDFYNDGTIDIQTPFARIKLQATYRSSAKGKWRTDFTGPDFHGIENFYELSDCEVEFRTQVMKVRYTLPQGQTETVDYEGRKLTSAGTGYCLDYWMEPLVEVMEKEDSVNISALCRILGNNYEACDQDPRKKQAPHLVHYILLMKAFLWLREITSHEFGDGIWGVDDMSCPDELAERIETIINLAKALESV